jgi:hypothetical protein
MDGMIGMGVASHWQSPQSQLAAAWCTFLALPHMSSWVLLVCKQRVIEEGKRRRAQAHGVDIKQEQI